MPLCTREDCTFGRDKHLPHSTEFCAERRQEQRSERAVKQNGAPNDDGESDEERTESKEGLESIVSEDESERGSWPWIYTLFN